MKEIEHNKNEENIKNESKHMIIENNKNKEINSIKENNRIKENNNDENIEIENHFIDIIRKEIEKQTATENNKIENNNVQIKNKEKSINIILSSVATIGKEQISQIYLKKVNNLSNIYNYTSNYLAFISELFQKISEPFYFQLSDTYIKNVKPYFKYFKELVIILDTFNEQLNLLNTSFENKKEEDYLMLAENNLNSAVKKINTTYADTSSVIIKNLKEKIINNPLFAKYETLENKFEDNFNKMLNLISHLEKYRIKYNTEYNKKYSNIFKKFRQQFKEEINPYLIAMKDFFLIEDDIINSANKSIEKVTIFLKEIRIIYEESLNIFCDFLEMLKVIIKIYYEENKKIILPNLLNEKMLNDLEKLAGQNIRKNLEKKFSIKNIIQYYKEESLRIDVNHLLLKYQDILVQYEILKTNEIKDLTLFNIKQFKTTEIFFNFLLSLISPKFKVNYDDEIKFMANVKRKCGLLKGWKKCKMIVSYQGHILFFDEQKIKKNENFKKRSLSGQDFNINKDYHVNIPKELGLSVINIPGNKNKEDIFKKSYSDFEFTNNEMNYGIASEKLSFMYYKTNFRIQKKNNKDGKYLFEIYEKGIGNKKNNINVFDALEQKILENILFELTEKNIYAD